MFFSAADGSDAVTIGLGVIAAALFFGEFAFFKWIYGPALDRADKQLTSSEDRHKEELAIIRATHVKEINELREAIRRLEEKNDKQSGVLEDKALPALINATNTVSQLKQFLEVLREDQIRMIRERELEDARKEALRDRAGG